MSRKKEEVELVLGIPSDKRKVTINLPPDEPRPWDMTTKLTTAGKRHSRQEAVQKVTGAAKYSWDMNLPGMLVAGFVRSPIAAGRVKSVDLSKARALKGVHATMETHRGKIFYAGSYVAAVAAEDQRTLDEALRLVKVEYEEQPHAAHVDQAMKKDAPQVSDQRPNVQLPRPGRRAPKGRVEKVAQAMDKADKVVEATCTTQVQTHSSLETHGLVAKWDGDQLTMWVSTQSTFGSRRLARSLNVPQSQVTVITEYMGGGFGSKFSAGYPGPVAAKFAKETGRPVKLMLSRREEHTDTGNRPGSWQKMKLGVTKDGKLGPYKVELLGFGGYGGAGGPRNPMIYDWPRDLVDRRAGSVLTNSGRQAAFRAPGHPEGAFGQECMLDLAAEAIGMDPLAFRIRNNSNQVRDLQFKEGAKLIGWSERKPNGVAQGRVRKGLGVAAATWGIGGRAPAEALCRIHRDGSVEIRSGAQDIGTGTRTLLALVVAEELGLPEDAVTCFIGNTNDPIGPASGGSQTAPSLSPAARQAAFLVGRDLKLLAAKHLECEASELVFKGGKVVHVSDAKRALGFKDACRLITSPSGEISALGKRKTNWKDATYQSDVAGCQFAEVEVDTHFGNVRVTRIVAMQDAGIVINKMAAESQVFGAVIQGCSYALLEERHLDRHKGHMLNADLEAYKILGAGDMPEIQVVMHTVSNGASNTSVCGLGEPPTVPTSAAIAGAVHNAIGVRIKDIPITPDKVLAALA